MSLLNRISFFDPILSITQSKSEVSNCCSKEICVRKRRDNMITQSMKRAFSSVSKRFPGSVTLYRTKSALDFKPIAASRESFTTKDGLEATQVSRQGTLLLRFAPANQGSEGSGKFAWNDSIMIGLTPLELGSLLIDIPEGKGLTFYRDTNMSGKLRGDSTGGYMYRYTRSQPPNRVGNCASQKWLKNNTMFNEYLYLTYVFHKKLRCD
mmetsp:Transcript_16027/g.19037  ORF Transcript_16027/g.19037 Transcript_16027/m.19037 type:complete len:209 (-) Transcript_16027:1915-2541(-)